MSGNHDAAEPTLRADALRNRRVLLDTAAAVLAEKGLSVPVSYIAREAGLGKATVFRRFPTKESLVAAVIEDRLSQLADLGHTLADTADPCAALREFIAAGARLLAENRGVCEVMYSSLSAGDSQVFTAYGHIIGTVRTLLTRCQQADAVRDDVAAEDLILLQHGIAQAAGPLHDAYPDLWQRYFDLMWDGLRPGGAGELSGVAPVFPGIPDTRDKPGASKPLAACLSIETRPWRRDRTGPAASGGDHDRTSTAGGRSGRSACRAARAAPGGQARGRVPRRPGAAIRTRSGCPAGGRPPARAA